jgi:predicted metalloprotease
MKFLAIILALAPTLALAAPKSSIAEQNQPKDDMSRFVSKVLGSTELQWKQIFAKDGRTYRAPVLVLYRGNRGTTQVNCGGKAYSAMGPFYCPADEKV